MKSILLLGLLAFAIARHPVNQDIVNEIRSGNANWRAADVESNPLSWLTEEQVNRLTGTHLTAIANNFVDNDGENAPASFDPRDGEWADCIHPIRNQAQCGSCWAFGSSEAFSDLHCIAGGKNDIYSPQDLVSCDTNDMACNGGWLDKAW